VDFGLLVLGVVLSLAPLPLIFRCLHPKAALGISVLVGLASVVLAVSFFWLWQWLQHPLIAYLDATLYGLLALQAILVTRIGRDERLPPTNSGTSRGLPAQPLEQQGHG
jgi:hypothetical protein